MGLECILQLGACWIPISGVDRLDSDFTRSSRKSPFLLLEKRGRVPRAETTRVLRVAPNLKRGLSFERYVRFKLLLVLTGVNFIIFEFIR